MLAPRRILLASHGTPGAGAAEEAALDLATSASELLHLVVVPEFWRGMMGDDWLNNVSTRDAYCRHVESQLAREIEQHRQTLEPRVRAAGARYLTRSAIGRPAECLLDCAREWPPELVVIGSPRPRSVAGLRSRMRIDVLITGLAAPLLIAPYPK